MPVHLPISKSLYNDMVRLSDGKLDPTEWIEHGFLAWLETMAISDPDWFVAKFGKRTDEFLAIHLPNSPRGHIDHGLALRWKNVTVAAGSEVRMEYGGVTHHAVVKDGQICDEDGSFSPSEWASKVANNTSRNAWRDIWFQMPGRTDWVLAQSLRKNS